MMIRSVFLLTAVLTLAACEAPHVFPGADKRQNSKSGRIEGTAVVTSLARGKVVLFLYDAGKPPPPSGTGRPLAFTVLSRADVFGEADPLFGGPFTAPFSFSLVPPGTYLVRGFVDANDDFVPWFSVTSDTNTGDVGGAAVDALTRAQRTVTVQVDGDGDPMATLDVPVSFSDALRVPVDRPVFELPGPAVLGATPLPVELVKRSIEDELVRQPSPIFLAQFLDANLDGVPDDANSDGIPDFWPRVVVRKLKDGAVLTDEADGDYEHKDPMTGVLTPPDGVPDVVVLAAGFDVSPIAADLLDSMGRVKLVPTPKDRLRLIVQPRALDVSNPAAPKVLSSVPKGRYAITVIQSTGQTWRVPNELSPKVAEGIGFTSIDSQEFVITVE